MQHITRTFVEYYCAGFDRGYWQEIEITGKDSSEEMAQLHQQLLKKTGVEQVHNYRTYQKSEVHLPHGEVLHGEQRNHSGYTIFGDVHPVSDHARKRYHLAQDCTHYTSLGNGNVVWLSQKGSDRVFTRDGGQLWPAVTSTAPSVKASKAFNPKR